MLSAVGEAKLIKNESYLGEAVDHFLESKGLKTRYAKLLKAESKKALLDEFKTSFMRNFKGGSKGTLNKKQLFQFQRDLLKMVTKPAGPSMLTLVEQKGLVDKFQLKCYSSKFTIIPGETQ